MPAPFRDPLPWLLAQTGDVAVRARCALGIAGIADLRRAREIAEKYTAAQCADGSFDNSTMKTAGIALLCSDLRVSDSPGRRAARYLLDVLMRQPGYERARMLSPGSLRNACDLCGFFGPYSDRGLPDAVAMGAREMNVLREFDPLLGPKTPVRSERQSPLDRVGPGSCYAWGLTPLCYAIEAVCRAGLAGDARLPPALNALLGAQRESGGWCRNQDGHAACTLHAVRALGAHPQLRESAYMAKALVFFHTAWRAQRVDAFAALRALVAIPTSLAREVIADLLAAIFPRQRRDGSFGPPASIERVAVVYAAAKRHALDDWRGIAVPDI